MTRSAHPLVAGFADIDRGVVEAEPADRAGEVARAVLRSPVMAQRDPAGDVGLELTEPVDEGLVDRLQGSEPGPARGDVGRGLGGVVVDGGEQQHSAVLACGGHRRTRPLCQHRLRHASAGQHCVLRVRSGTAPGSVGIHREPMTHGKGVAGRSATRRSASVTWSTSRGPLAWPSSRSRKTSGSPSTRFRLSCRSRHLTRWPRGRRTSRIPRRPQRSDGPRDERARPPRVRTPARTCGADAAATAHLPHRHPLSRGVRPPRPSPWPAAAPQVERLGGDQTG